MTDVRLVDLEVLKRFSLALRQEFADAEDVLDALDASREVVMEALGDSGRPVLVTRPGQSGAAKPATRGRTSTSSRSTGARSQGTRASSTRSGTKKATKSAATKTAKKSTAAKRTPAKRAGTTTKRAAVKKTPARSTAKKATARGTRRR